MKTFEYTIKDELGIHARPAGMIVKEAKKYESRICIIKEGKTAEATKLMALMQLAVKCGQTIQVEVEGPDESGACEGMKHLIESNL